MIERDEYLLCKSCDVPFRDPDLHLVFFSTTQVHELIDHVQKPFGIVMDKMKCVVGDRLRIVYRKDFLKRRDYQSQRSSQLMREIGEKLDTSLVLIFAPLFFHHGPTHLPFVIDVFGYDKCNDADSQNIYAQSPPPCPDWFEYFKLENSWFRIPNSVVVGSLDHEFIYSRRKIRVIDHVYGTCFLPLIVRS